MIHSYRLYDLGNTNSSYIIQPLSCCVRSIYPNADERKSVQSRVCTVLDQEAGVASVVIHSVVMKCFGCLAGDESQRLTATKGQSCFS